MESSWRIVNDPDIACQSDSTARFTFSSSLVLDQITLLRRLHCTLLLSTGRYSKLVFAITLSKGFSLASISNHVVSTIENQPLCYRMEPSSLFPDCTARARGKMFRSGGKFLRPDQQDYDDESSDEEEEEEDDAPPPRNANMNLDDDEEEDDEDDDDEDDEEEDDEEEKKRRAPSASGGPKKRSKMSSFFDEEAQDDEDDEEDDDEPYGTHRDPHDIVKKHYTEEDIRREQMDDEAQELIRQQDRRRQQAGRFNIEEEDERSVAAMARAIEERHRMQRRTVDRSYLDRGPSVPDRVDDDGGSVHASYTAVSQQSLVPSVSDPSLWMVNCLTGKEEELVYQIMNKSIAFARQGRPLGITGVIASQTKGKIYIESYSEPAVVDAIQGIRGLMQYSMRLIPIGDMTTVMTVKPVKVPGKLTRLCRCISCFPCRAHTLPMCV